MRGASAFIQATPWANERSVDQMLTQALPTGVVRRMMPAAKVGSSIGSTQFVIPPRTMETFRSAFIAATCGERL